MAGQKNETQVDVETQKEIDDAVTQAIDGLETPAAEAEASAEPKDIEDFRGSSGDESMEETLATLKEQEEAATGAFADDAGEEGEDDVNENSEETVDETETETEASSEDGELTLSLTGNMTLRLKYQYEGQDVIIGFKDHALQVRLSDGTEFKVPIRKRGLKLVS